MEEQKLVVEDQSAAGLENGLPTVKTVPQSQLGLRYA
jgi:hypothetical protein